jgi:hypothetical protein
MSRFGPILLGAIVIAQVAPSYAIDQVTLYHPNMDDKVCRQALVGGTAPIGTEEVWLIVRSMEVPQQFRVQHSASVDHKGGWELAAYFGDPGPAHVGIRYEMRAFVGVPLKAETILDGWPTVPKERGTTVVRVTRDNC